MQSTDWTPEQSKALGEYLAKGMSYSAVRNAINATFKTTFSRNATISRARRMGLAASDRPGRPKPPPKVTSLRLHRVRERGAAQMPWLPPTFKSMEMPKLRYADVVPRHLSLMDIERGDCRYPYGGDKEGEAITFCAIRAARAQATALRISICRLVPARHPKGTPTEACSGLWHRICARRSHRNRSCPSLRTA
jgi:GcrA cell cycle regulator